MRFVWIPEAPEHPGLYANQSDRSQEGKTGCFQPSTMSAHHAKQFATEAECKVWCDENPTPRFVPRAHGFEESV